MEFIEYLILPPICLFFFQISSIAFLVLGTPKRLLHLQAVMHKAARGRGYKARVMMHGFTVKEKG